MPTELSIPQAAFSAQAKIYSSDAALAAGTLTGSWIPIEGFTNGVFMVDVTAVTTGTINVYIQRQLPNGDADDIVSFTQLNSVTKRSVHFFPAAQTADAATQDAALTAGSVKSCGIGRWIRVKIVVAGANPAAQVDVYAQLFA